jgi:hypothetical protein
MNGKDKECFCGEEAKYFEYEPLCEECYREQQYKKTIRLSNKPNKKDKIRKFPFGKFSE